MKAVMAFLACGDVPARLKALEQRAREETRECGNTPVEFPPLPFPVSLTGYHVLTDTSPNNTDELVSALCEAYEATPHLYLAAKVKPSHPHEVPLSLKKAQQFIPLVLAMSERLDVNKPPSLRGIHRKEMNSDTTIDLCHRSALWCRDACMVRNAERVVVFGEFVRPEHASLESPLRCNTMIKVASKEGRIVQSVIDHNREFPEIWKELFVFDVIEERWFVLEKDRPEWQHPLHKAIMPFLFLPMASGDSVPILARRTLLVGNATTDVRHIVRYMFRRTMDHVFHCRTVRTGAYDDWLDRQLRGHYTTDPMPPVPADIPVQQIVREMGPSSTWVWVWGHGWLHRRSEPSEGWTEESPVPPYSVARMVRFWTQRWETLKEWRDRCQRVEAWVFGEIGDSDDEEVDRPASINEVIEVAESYPNSELAQYMFKYRITEPKIAAWVEKRKNRPAAVAALRGGCTRRRIRQYLNNVNSECVYR